MMAARNAYRLFRKRCTNRRVPFGSAGVFAAGFGMSLEPGVGQEFGEFGRGRVA